MDNLRKTNTVLGTAINLVNSDTTDDELDSMMNQTIGEWIDAMAAIPECIRKLTFDKLFTFILKALDNTEKTDEDFEEIGALFFDHDPTEAEMQEALDGLELFGKAFGW